MKIPVRHRAQLASRRVEVLLLPPLQVGNLREALESLDLNGGIESDPYLRRSLKIILARAEDVLLEEPADSPLVPIAIEAVGRAGTGLSGSTLVDSDLSDSEQWLILRTMALAQRLAFDRDGDFDAGEKAFASYEALVRSRPNDIRALEGLVAIADSTGRLEDAVDAQRVLLNGASPGSDTFYERKIRFLELLSRHDAERARKVLAQHVVLYPDYGPGRWGSRLRTLHQSLGGGTP